MHLQHKMYSFTRIGSGKNVIKINEMTLQYTLRTNEYENKLYTISGSLCTVIAQMTVCWVLPLRSS